MRHLERSIERTLYAHKRQRPTEVTIIQSGGPSTTDMLSGDITEPEPINTVIKRAIELPRSIIKSFVRAGWMSDMKYGGYFDKSDTILLIAQKDLDSLISVDDLVLVEGNKMKVSVMKLLPKRTGYVLGLTIGAHDVGN